jgi:hypothetical protein
MLPREPINEAKENHVMCPLHYSNLSTKLSTIHRMIGALDETKQVG